MLGSQKFRNGVQRTMDAGFLNVPFHRAGYQVLFHLIFSGQIEGSPAWLLLFEKLVSELKIAKRGWVIEQLVWMKIDDQGPLMLVMFVG